MSQIMQQVSNIAEKKLDTGADYKHFQLNFLNLANNMLG